MESNIFISEFIVSVSFQTDSKSRHTVQAARTKDAMNAIFTQLQLRFNDGVHRPGICKGQRSAEDEQRQSERQHLH